MQKELQQQQRFTAHYFAQVSIGVHDFLRAPFTCDVGQRKRTSSSNLSL